jgi:UDP-2,4-diacetamido-2,4,6-trideoxy-beta-L-altropyranose hydrolase
VKEILFRADASGRMGTGHFMRCLALAQAWQTGDGKATFVSSSASTPLESRLAAEGMKFAQISALPGSADDVQQTLGIAQQCRAEWIVLDGYHFGARYQRSLKDGGFRLLLIDDFGHAGDYSADLLLNQNIFANESYYISRASTTCLLLGTRYALLRREFWPWQGWTREIQPTARRVLITMGGTDPDNVTLKAIEALQLVGVEGLQGRVVVGGSSMHEKALQSAIANLSGPTGNCTISLARDVVDMPRLMSWADAAVSGGGTTCLEAAFMGLPSLVVILADNQRLVAEALEATGLSVNLGWHTLMTAHHLSMSLSRLLAVPGRRAEMAHRGQALVDGEGAMRVLMHLQESRVRLRKVRLQDRERVWEWANEPQARAVSFSSDPIPWDQHVRWFEARLTDAHCRFYVAINREEEPVGQVRYDIDDGEAEVSVTVSPRFRGKGLGGEILRRGAAALLNESDVVSIRAFVKEGNAPSVRVFRKAGFREAGTAMIRGHRALRFTLRRGEVL